MKKIIHLAIMLLAAAALQAQQKGEVHVKKADGSYLYYYSDAGKVSTLIFWDISHKTGYAVAYNAAGKEVYRRETSWMHGSETVKFKYHPDGVVREAHYHWQPDGGIQSGGMFTFFDQQGNKTGEREETDPMDPFGGKKPPRPGPKTTPASPAKPPQPPAPNNVPAEVPLYRTSFYIVNRAKKPVTVVPKDKSELNLPEGSAWSVTVPPGDTLKAGSYTQPGEHANPASAFDFRIETRKKKWKKKLAFQPQSSTFRDLKPTEREYFLFVESR